MEVTCQTCQMCSLLVHHFLCLSCWLAFHNDGGCRTPAEPSGRSFGEEGLPWLCALVEQAIVLDCSIAIEEHGRVQKPRMDEKTGWHVG